MTEPQGQENPTPETTSEPTPTPTPTPDAKYTDKDVDKLKGDARREAKKVARTEREQEILEATGAQSVDEVLEAYKAWQTVQEETATETDKERNAREKAEKERDEANQKATDALKLADERAMKAELKVALIDAGARKDKLSKLLREADLSEVEVDGDEVKGIDSVVTKLQTDEADWFGSQHQSLPNSPTGSNHQAKDSAYKPRYNIPGAN